MNAVMLACGLGTRITGETPRKPKTLIESGGTPVAGDIMQMAPVSGGAMKTYRGLEDYGN